MLLGSRLNFHHCTTRGASFWDRVTCTGHCPGHLRLNWPQHLLSLSSLHILLEADFEINLQEIMIFDWELCVWGLLTQQSILHTLKKFIRWEYGDGMGVGRQQWDSSRSIPLSLWILGSKIAADCDCSHEIKRHLLLGRKATINLDSILKSRDITLSTKVHLVKAVVFQ